MENEQTGETVEKKGAKAKNRRRGMYCPDEIWARVQEEAKRQDRSANWVIVAAIKAYCVNAAGVVAAAVTVTLILLALIGG